MFLLSVALWWCSSAVGADAAGGRDARWRWEKQALGLSRSEQAAHTPIGTGIGNCTCALRVHLPGRVWCSSN